jgi:hypothetical protein
MKGKNRLVPRLLGVTKDSVLRLDENSKQILKTWPLTTVRRWAASPNVFTLDFGDYQAKLTILLFQIDFYALPPSHRLFCNPRTSTTPSKRLRASRFPN